MKLQLVLMSLLPSTLLACGGFFCEPNTPVLQRGEAIAFFVEDNEVTMHVQILYEGPAEGFSWLLPVPETPELSIGTDLLFRGLFDSTLPTFEFEVINQLSRTCSLEDVEGPIMCPMLNQMNSMASMADDAGPESAEVIEEGSVGPFEFVVLEAAEGNPSGVFDWLEENGYDQPDEAASLLNYYALQGQKFVALRLRKDSETGEIEPIVLKFQMPPSDGAFQDEAPVEVSRRRRAMACVPIQLTRIAATDNMPIQVYVLGDARAVPLNYLEVKLDDTKVDWVGCNNNDLCYDNDYRERFAQVTDQISEHAFVTEYAGNTSIVDNRIAINLTTAELETATNPVSFLVTLSNANVPDTRRVLSVIDEFIPYRELLPKEAPFFCQDLTTAYQGPANAFGNQRCLSNYVRPTNWTWDPVGLAAALDQAVFQPSVQAQAMVSQSNYLTRLYTRLSPSQMSKDPFFAFQPDLPTVSNQHVATAVPECRDDGTPIALEITIGGQLDAVGSFRVPATMGCRGWFPTSPIAVENSNVSLAEQVASWGFPGDEGVVVLQGSDGTMDWREVQRAIAFGDSLVVNQTIPEYVMIVTDDEMPTTNATKPINESSAQSTNGTAADDDDVSSSVSKAQKEKEEESELEDDEGIDEKISDNDEGENESSSEEEVVVESSAISFRPVRLLARLWVLGLLI